MFFVSLPWYDFVELHEVTNNFWLLVQEKLLSFGIEAPIVLCRNQDYRKQWESSQLLFSQACGYDVAKPYSSFLEVIATPCYDVPGCENNQYSSFIITHKNSEIYDINNLDNFACAINENESHSGKNIFYFMLNQMNKTKQTYTSVFSGSHENSIRMVANKEVDIACIDCVSFFILQTYRPEFVKNIRVILQTPYAPAPPYVTSVFRTSKELQILQQTLREVVDSPKSLEFREKLFLKDIMITQKKDYDCIINRFSYPII